MIWDCLAANPQHLESAWAEYVDQLRGAADKILFSDEQYDPRVTELAHAAAAVAFMHGHGTPQDRLSALERLAKASRAVESN
ncbi:hypothetical protein BTO20_16320 [Mycobacterium dioxanotrophicus]|uniref:Uncharacterized protein n=1 Tax=Mycobacterium dioxanotrophicus TaxID=482462 RepID=A0A1Y0C457_9MYCO|nr:hypothetical protein BTO20_16320 [Mycobacterium dioxanotrophicus]